MAITPYSTGPDYRIPAPRGNEAVLVSTPEQLVMRETDELHAYVRLNFRLLIQWLIFFLSLNWLAMAYALQPERPFRLAVSLLFLSQCLQGIVIAEAVRRYFVRTAERIQTLLDGFRTRLQVDVHSPMPLKLYGITAISISVCLSLNVVVWISIITRSLGGF